MSDNKEMRDVLEVFAGRCPPIKTLTDEDDDLVFVSESSKVPTAVQAEFADA